MKIEHIALWVSDLEKMREFYTRYFSGKANALYTNRVKQFQSYFITFEDGCRLELMHRPDIADRNKAGILLGPAHFAVSVGNRATVDSLTAELEKDGYAVLSGPRVTGDGYYESVIQDPENNTIEITE
ncbi:VOC family protein [Brucepastera parasyntrophica]|uniref:VOC family protein n=1 Tax=Brucepastera parasyntrophica TaxID=2880008 RepID=UPI00210CCEE4|nr:VOC family protein [Brucepastera parasyntrophica]ULQ58752.1 VOC family protein [Brucepastera parasyntrophica]